jgi:hypothetical protein
MFPDNSVPVDAAGIPEGHILSRCFLRVCPFLINLNEILKKISKKRLNRMARKGIVN